jgi:hypothetical protein
MANGPQIAARNTAKFSAWVAERQAADDWASYVRMDQLNRTEIARECGFAVSVLRQNPAVKDALARLERDLAAHGILPRQDKSDAPERHSATAAGRDKQRLNQMEQQKQALRAENDGLRAQLKRYGLLDEFLLETGRLPR